MSFRNEQALCRLRSIGEENDFGVEMHLLDDVLTTAVDADTLNRSPDEDSEVCFHQEVSEASAETLKGKHGTRMSTSATASGEKHEATHMGFGGWEVKPWSFLRECNAELVTAGSSMTRSFVDRETVGSSEWMRVWMAYLAVKETALRSLHLDILKLLENVLQYYGKKNESLFLMDPQKLANLCSHVEEIFFRTGQVTHALSGNPNLRSLWPLAENGEISGKPPDLEEREIARPSSLSPNVCFDWNGPAVSISRSKSEIGTPSHHSMSLEQWMSRAINRLQQVLVCLRAQKETLTEVMQQTEEGVPSVGCRQRDRGKEAWLELQERFPFLPDTELLRKQTVYVRESDCKAARELLHSLIGALEVLGNNFMTPMQPNSANWNTESSTLLIDSNTKFRCRKLMEALHAPQVDGLEKCETLAAVEGDADILKCVMKKKARLVAFSDGQHVIKQGTVGMALYFGQSGSCKIVVNGTQVGSLGNGCMFGECALVLTSLRTADVIADGFFEAWVISRQELAEIMTWCPRLLSMLIDSGKACLSRGMSSGIPAVGLSLEKENESGLQVRDKATEVSRNVLAPLQMLFSKDMLDARPVAPVSSFSRIFSKTSFANSFSWSFPSPDSIRRKFPLEGEGVNEEKLAKDAWEDLKNKLERIELKKGDVLYPSGVSIDCIFVVEKGKLALTVDGTQVGVVNEAQIFGEVELLLSGKTIVDTVASTDVMLLKLYVTDFIAALCRSPCFFDNLVGLGRSRMREWARKAPSILAP